MQDHTLTLPDGRTLAYCDGGTEDGPVVFYFHGELTSRQDLAPLEHEFHSRGVRVVAADRPGRPADVAALADHLGIGRFAVIGLASGGPYALACAALLPTRVTAAGVVAGVTDVQPDSAWGFDPGDIVVPVRVLHGEADSVVPLAHGRHTAAIVPTATLRVVPGLDHAGTLPLVPGLAAELTGVPPHRARLTPRQPGDDPALTDMFAKGLNGPDGSPLNIFGTLAHHPDLLRRWLVFATHTLSKNTLPERDRELLILRTGWNCASRYEFGQHVVIGLRCGITAEEIEAVKVGPRASWSDADRLLLVAADELHARSGLSETTWTALLAHYSTEQVLDLVATVGNYHLVAMLLNSTGVELDAGVPDHLPLPGTG